MSIGNLYGGGTGGLIGGSGGTSSSIEGVRSYQSQYRQNFTQYGNSPLNGSSSSPGTAYQSGFPQGEDMQNLQRQMQALGGGGSSYGDIGGALASGAQLNSFMNLDI
jgi:hypothetical protein